MPIWAQVRDLPFELKTESMGWTLGDQLGDVIAVSHRNHVIVEKYLRVRVEIPLHDPLKNKVEFIPLGSSKKSKFDVMYEKLPLYGECCGLVGHTSERFCSIPAEKRNTIYPNNLSVEAYLKGQGSSKRAIHFGGFPRSGEPLVIGSGNRNPPSSTEGLVVKVATAMSSLTVSGKGDATPDKATAVALAGASHPSSLLGQEGQAVGAALGAHAAALPCREGEAFPQASPMGSGQEGQAWLLAPARRSGQEGQSMRSGQEGQDLPLAPSRRSGQEGQGLDMLTFPSKEPAHDQEGQGARRGLVSRPVVATAGTSRWHPDGQEGLLGQPLKAVGDATAPNPIHGTGQEGQFLFQPGVLEALTGAVAAKIAAANATGS